MRTAESSLRRHSVLLVTAVVCVSVLTGYACGTGNINLVAGLAGVVFFALLVWDLRIIVPIMVVAGPFGPKFPLSFGNLYLSTVVVIMGFAAWLWRNPLMRQAFTIRRNRITDAMLVFLGIMFISSLQNLSYLISNSLYLLRFIQFFFYTSFFVVVLSLAFTRQQIKAVLALVLVVGLAEAAVGVGQWLTNPGVYVAGTFDYRHSNYAVYVVFITLVLLGVLMESRRRSVSLALLVGFGLMLCSVIFSFSRGAYVSLAAGCGTVFAMPHTRRRKQLLLAVLTIGIITLVTVLPSGVFERTQTIATALTGRDAGISFEARLGMWRRALEDFARYPILGKGTWSYGLRDSFYVKMLGETGIIGTCAFLWLIVALLRTEWHAVRSRIDDGFVRGVTYGLLPATVASVAVFNLSGDLFTLHRFMGTFWIVLALVLLYPGAQESHGHVGER
jgi:O-antigen ligase